MCTSSRGCISAGALEGAGEVLIIPHGDLLTVPWAALLDESQAERRRYLIQRHVVRVAPSLRVARAAARAVASRSPEHQGRSVVVGNPLPTKEKPLPFAEMEAEEVLTGSGKLFVGFTTVRAEKVKKKVLIYYRCGAMRRVNPVHACKTSPLVNPVHATRTSPRNSILSTDAN